jgi:hypothetical protein
LEKVQGSWGVRKISSPWLISLPIEDAEIGHSVSDSEGEEVSNWSDPVDNEHISPKGLFHSTTVSWVLLILQCLMIVWHTKVGDGWQLQECSILWKMENHCINGWSKRMNIVYCNIFHGCEWFSGLEFLVIESEFWQLQSWLLANHLLVFSIAYGLVQFMSQLENARDSHFRIKPRFLQQKQDLLLLHYSMVSWNYVEEP